MQLGGYFAIARRWWLTITAAVVMAGVGAYIVVSQVPKVYEAEVRILVGPLNADLNTQRAAGQLANTYAQIVTSQRLTEVVIERLGLEMQPLDLQEAMTAIPNDVTRLVTIRVRNGDPDTAADLANAIAAELGVLGSAAGRPEGEIEVIDPAEAAAAPVGPQVPLIVLLAAFAGLLTAISAVVLVEYARGSLRSEDEVEELTAAPILGRLTIRLPHRDFPSAVLGSEAGEAYRAMTARIEHSLGGKQLRSLLVVPARAESSASVIAAGLALAFADRGLATALVGASPQGRDEISTLGLASGPEYDIGTGAGDFRLTRTTVLVEGRQGVPTRPVALTAAAFDAGREVRRTDEMEALLDGLLDDAEIVVVGSSPIHRSPEAVLWARTVDAIVMVVAHPGDTRDDVTSSVDALRLAGLTLVGTIVTEGGAPSTFRRERLAAGNEDRVVALGAAGQRDVALGSSFQSRGRRRRGR